MKRDTIKMWIYVSLAFGFLLFVTCCVAQAIFIFNESDEPKLDYTIGLQNYTIGHCIEWNNTFTEKDLMDCNLLDKDGFVCTYNIINYDLYVTIKNNTCIDDWFDSYEEGVDANITAYDDCYLSNYKDYPCTARIVVVEEW